MDDIPDEQLKKYSQATKKLAMEKYGSNAQSNSVISDNTNRNTINSVLSFKQSSKA